MVLVGTQLDRFVEMLTAVEQASRGTNGLLTEWESEFVQSMREKFDSREDLIDMGLTPWSPTTNQWNTLHGLWSTL